jgi:hypothetical protein
MRNRPAAAMVPWLAEVPMDKIESFMFSVAPTAAGLITPVTLPVA